jgi:hypothetical protein
MDELLTAAVTPHRASLGASGLTVVDPEPQPAVKDAPTPTASTRKGIK